MHPVKTKYTKYVYALGLICVFLSGLAWVLASPIGGSPDDDYHMGSIWCPRGTDTCETKIVRGQPEKMVPEPVARASSCHAFHPERSGECTNRYRDGVKAPTARYDRGTYPPGYYRFQHLFVRPDVGTSVLLMRTVNLLIAVALLGTLAVTVPSRFREHYLLAMLVSWIPMGWYFIASINPSSWAIVGVFVYAAALFSSLWGTGKMRWVNLALALPGAVLAVTSRGDSAFYLFVVTLALVFAVPRKRWKPPHVVLGALLSVAGVLIMFSAGQSTTVVKGSVQHNADFFKTLRQSLLFFGEYFAGFFGRNRGPGWFDVSLDGPVTIYALILFGAVLLTAIRSGSLRKWLSAAVVLGTIFAVPMMSVLKGMTAHYIMYQPRYMLPLLAVLMFLLLAGKAREKIIFSPVQLGFLFFGFALVHALSLRLTLWRYVSGLDNVYTVPFNLDANIRWWWNIPVSPFRVWIISSLLFAAALCLFAVVLRVSGAQPKQGGQTGAETDPRCAPTALKEPVSALPAAEISAAENPPAC